MRVVAPDVGGGFGPKARLYPEEIILAALALELDHPVRWIEDRNEHLLTAAHTRDHHYRLTAYADRRGKILGIDTEITVDAGAYGLWPQGPYQEANMAARTLPGPYKIAQLPRPLRDGRDQQGAARPLSRRRPPRRLLRDRAHDRRGRARGRPRSGRGAHREHDPAASEMPYTSVTGMRYDTGDYPASVRLCAELLDLPGRSATRQQRGEPDGRLIGIGFASFTEQTAHGAAEFASRGASMIPGFESCTARILPDGSLVLMVGIQSHGQGLETTLSQIAAEELGIDPARISVRHGDTESTAFGFGTFASRSMVMSGGAVARASRMLRDKIERIGAHLLQCELAEARCAGGAVHRAEGPLGVARRDRQGRASAHARTAARRRSRCSMRPPPTSRRSAPASTPTRRTARSLRSIRRPARSNCSISRWPRIAARWSIRCSSRARSAAASCRASAPRCTRKSPMTSTASRSPRPCSTTTCRRAFEMPPIRIGHLHTPATATEYGMKGMGEGGAVAPPAAIANAVRDALAPLGVEINETPLTAERVLAAIRKGRPPS